MKNIFAVILIVSVMAGAAFAIDGAQGIGQGKMKLEAGYSGGSAGLQFDYGLSQDWTVYGVVSGVSGITGFGVGTKYAVINEKRGDGFSLAPKLDLLLAAGGVMPAPGLIISKQLNEKVTLLGDVSVMSMTGLSFTWFGAGALYNLNDNFQLAGQLGVATISMNYLGYKYSVSGLGFGLGVNYLF